MKFTFDSSPDRFASPPGDGLALDEHRRLDRFTEMFEALASHRTEPVYRRKLAICVAKELRGALGRRVLDVAERFRKGEDGGEGDDAYTLAALRARLALGRAAAELDDAALSAALDAIDRALSPAGSALLLLDATEYRDATRGAALDPAAWYGWRDRVDAALPEETLDRALDAIRLSLN